MDTCIINTDTKEIKNITALVYISRADSSSKQNKIKSRDFLAIVIEKNEKLIYTEQNIY